MFRSVPPSIIRSFYCTRSNGICHTGLLIASEQDQDGTDKLLHLVGFIISYIYIYILSEMHFKYRVSSNFNRASTRNLTR